MPAFAAELDPKDIENIRAYIVSQAREADSVGP